MEIVVDCGMEYGMVERRLRYIYDLCMNNKREKKCSRFICKFFSSLFLLHGNEYDIHAYRLRQNNKKNEYDNFLMSGVKRNLL